MSKLDKKFFGENATADNWNNTGGAVIKVEYDQGNSITLPKHEDETEDVVSTSFNLTVECSEEQLAAKVMLENEEALLAELGLSSDNYKITAEGGEDKEVVVTIAEATDTGTTDTGTAEDNTNK